MKLTRTAFRFVLAALLWSGVTQAQELPKWIRDWQAFAKTSGNPKDQDWVKAISDPQSVSLQKEWAQFRGLQATDLIEEAYQKGLIPQDIKPGLVITEQNYDKIPSLKKVLPGNFFDLHLKKGAYGHIPMMRIVPPGNYYLSREQLQGFKRFKESGKNFAIGKDGWFYGPDGKPGYDTVGLPFDAKPKDGFELQWLNNYFDWGVEQLRFPPQLVANCNAQNKIDQPQQMHIWQMRFQSRTIRDPKPSVPGYPDVFTKSSFFLIEPLDVKGLTGTRTRFTTQKQDESLLYIPALRRTRVLASSDTQDPAGPYQTFTWDDWGGQWIKPDLSEFEYRRLDDAIILTSMGRHYDFYRDEVKKSGECIFLTDWELRPVWVLEARNKTGRYQYGKRLLFIDKEWFTVRYEEMTDKRGNSYKTYQEYRKVDPKTGYSSWGRGVIYDFVNKRATMGFMGYFTLDHPILEDPSVKPIHFNINYLKDFKGRG